VKFGRNRPAPHLRTGHKMAAKYFDAANMPPVPDAFDFSTLCSAPLADILGNSELSDCTAAGAGHLIDVFTAGGGSPVAITADETIAFYSLSTGYVPGDPSTDQGGDEVTVLTYWRDHGFDGKGNHPIAGFVQVDPTNATLLKAAVYYFGGLYFGIELPDTYTHPFPASNGYVWAPGTPDPNQGHCVVGCGADATGIHIDSWGLLGTLEYSAIAELCSESAGGMVFAVLSKEWVSKMSGDSPAEVDWTTLQADFAALS
jgi:hypothetical protein